MAAGIIAILSFYLLLFVIEHLVPPLIEGIGHCFRFLALAIYTAGAFLALMTWRGAIRLIKHALIPAAQFLLILTAELFAALTGDDPPESAEETAEESAEDSANFSANNGAGTEESACDPYGQALALFGLEAGFSRKSFDAAYRKAMKRAHPDLGGSTVEAQRLNEARSYLLKAHGWA